jgi:hypothetical protein
MCCVVCPFSKTEGSLSLPPRLRYQRRRPFVGRAPQACASAALNFGNRLLSLATSPAVPVARSRQLDPGNMLRRTTWPKALLVISEGRFIWGTRFGHGVKSGKLFAQEPHKPLPGDRSLAMPASCHACQILVHSRCEEHTRAIAALIFGKVP